MRASRLRIKSLTSAPSLGNRTTETIDGTTRYYTYDNNDKLRAVSGGGQSASLSYDSNGNPFDRLRASMTGVSGTVRDTYELDTFRRSVSSSGSTPNPYRGVYPERSRRGGAWGYITDPSGMLQLGARFYWPEVGRFVQQDPSGDGVNWYAYVDGNPLRGIDPTGLCDLFAIVEAEVATPYGGIDASVGLVVNIDTWPPRDWRLFSSGGPAAGLSAGLGFGGGFARQIEGFAQNMDANVGLLSIAASATPGPGEPWSPSNFNGLLLTAGPGGGFALSETQTDTTSVGQVWDRIKAYSRRVAGKIRGAWQRVRRRPGC